MGPLADGFFYDTTETIEENGALTTVDCIERRIEDSGADTEAEGGACDVVQE